MTRLKSAKPGDKFVWITTRNKRPVGENQNVWSRILIDWLPIGGTCVLISDTETERSWLHVATGRVCVAYKNDTTGIYVNRKLLLIKPCKQE